MDLKEYINQSFDEFINDKFKKEDIRNFLKNHERRHLVVENIKKEIDQMDKILNAESYKRSLGQKRAFIRRVSKDITRLFCKLALEVKAAEKAGDKITIKHAFDQAYDKPLEDKPLIIKE